MTWFRPLACANQTRFAYIIGGPFMADQKPLSENEKRFLRAFKLFLTLDPERSEIAQTFAGLSPEALDKLSPEQCSLIG